MINELDIDKLAEAVTQEILRRLNGGGSSVLVLDGCPKDIVSDGYAQASGIGSADYVLLTADCYRALTGATPSHDVSVCSEPAPVCCGDGEVVDLTNKRLLHERDLRDHNVKSGTVVRVSKKTIITALAADYAKGIGVKIIKV